jgi:hypothetical protein
MRGDARPLRVQDVRRGIQGAIWRQENGQTVSTVGIVIAIAIGFWTGSFVAGFVLGVLAAGVGLWMRFS